MTMILVSKEGESIKCQYRLRDLSLTLKYMTENISEDKFASGEEVIPLPTFEKETIQSMVKFCDIIDYKTDFVLKTKPIVKSTQLDELFFDNNVRDYFTSSAKPFIEILELANYLNFAILQDACMGFMAFTLY